MKWHHVGMYVQSIETSRAFYEEMFDFKAADSFQFLGEQIVFLKRGEALLELIEGKQNLSGMHMCFEVEDVEVWIERLRQRGLSPVEGPFRLDCGWKVVFYEGPDGEVIELLAK
jgi:lactoylglutathione lyase